MKSSLSIIGCATLLATTVATAKSNSDYTSLKEEDCQTLSMVDDLHQANCPSKQNYLLHTFSRDLKSGVALIYHNHEVSYQPIQYFHVGKTVEWRYEKIGNSKNYHALIYRIYTIQIDPLDGDNLYLPRDQDKQRLVVIRLDKKQSCLLGVIEPSKNMNTEARKLADNRSAKCIE